MPWVDVDDAAMEERPVGQVPFTTPAPPTSDVVSAIRKKDDVLLNVVSSAVDSYRNKFQPEEGYDPFDDMGGYENHAHDLGDAQSRDEMAFFKNKIDDERKTAEVIASGNGWQQMAGASTLIATDPTMLIPIGGALWKTYRTGGRILEGAARTAAYGAAVTTGQEAFLQATQMTRTKEESLTNIAAATLLSGLLGGAVGAIAPKTAAELAAQLDKDMVIPMDVLSSGNAVVREVSQEADEIALHAQSRGVELSDGQINEAAKLRREVEGYTNDDALADVVARREAFGESTVGAAAVQKLSAADTELAGNRVFKKVVAGYKKLPAFLKNPAMDLAVSVSSRVREIGNLLADHSLALNMHREGKSLGASVETKMKAYANLKAKYYQESLVAWKEYNERISLLRKQGGLPENEKLGSRKDGSMTFTEFFGEASKASRRGDAHLIPEVQKVAQSARKNVFSPIFARAKEVGFFKDLDEASVKTAESWLIRKPNVNKIKAERGKFKEVVLADLLEKEAHKAETRQALKPLLDIYERLKKEILAIERRIERRQDTADFVEARKEEASLMNKFAYTRSAEMSEPIDELRIEIDRIGASIEIELDQLKELAESIKAERENFPELVDFERQYQKISRALSDVKQNSDLVDMVDAADEIEAGLAELEKNWKAALSDIKSNIKNIRNTDTKETPNIILSNPLDEKKFYKQYVQHIDIKGRSQTPEEKVSKIEKIRTDGFIKGGNVNALPAYRGGKPQDMTRQKYAPLEGDIVYLAPKSAWKDAPNGAEIQSGWKPEPWETVVITNPEKPMYEYYIEAYKKHKDSLSAATSGNISGIDNLKSLEKQRSKLNKKIAPLKKKLKALRDEKASIEGVRKPLARGGAVFESKARDRVNKLSDNLSGKESAIDDLDIKLEKKRAQIEAAENELRDIIGAYEGKTSKAAKSAMRSEAARNTERAAAGKAASRTADDAVISAAKSIAKSLAKERAEVDELAENIIDRYINITGGRIPYEAHIGEGFTKDRDLRGSLKQRVWDIDDHKIEPWLENDLNTLVDSYTRTMSSDNELMGQFGTMDVNELKREIQSDYNKLRVRKEAGDKSLAKVDLDKAMEQDMKNLQSSIEKLRGVFAQPDDYASAKHVFERTALAWNFTRLLGDMVTSSIPDIGRHVMQHGIGRVFNDSFVSMIKDYKGFQMLKNEAMELGTALDMTTAETSLRRSHMDEFTPVTGRIDAFSNKASQVVATATGMNAWNAAQKTFAGIMIQNRMMKSVIKLGQTGKISAKEMEYLGRHGINIPMAKRISAQFDKHGEIRKVVNVPNAKLWDDVAARNAFRNAVRHHVDETIVTPGLDRPLWMSKPGFRLLSQFKSFIFSSTQRVTLAGLQQADAAAVQGILLMTFLGANVYFAKSWLGGRAISDDPTVWIAEGIDRSGITGWFFDVNNIVEKVTAGRIGVNALKGGPQMSRYASRNAVGALLGPTFGLAQDMFSVTGSAFGGDWSEKDTHAARKVLPLQNIPYLRGLFDQMEHSFNAVTGTPDSGKIKSYGTE